MNHSLLCVTVFHLTLSLSKSSLFYAGNFLFCNVFVLTFEKDNDILQMASNKIAFGLCKKYKIKLPKEATPKDAWEALNKIPADKFKEPLKISLSDEQWPRSVGAKWINHDIRMPDGTQAKFVEGAKLERKEIIAGHGSRRKIDTLSDLLTDFPETNTTPRLWTKVKGISEIVLKSGEHVKAEVHWYEHPKTGKQKFKYKDEADDES